MKYRLGADPERHGKADCLSLSRHILATYGIKTPNPERSWYRRLRRKDYSIFREQLSYGEPRQPTSVLALSLFAKQDGVGLATFIDDYRMAEFRRDGSRLESGRGPQYRKSLLP